MNFVYSKFLEKLILQEVFLLPGAQPADRFNVALFTKNYTPNQTGTEKYEDLVRLGYECVDPNAAAYAPENKGYQPGGQAITFKLMSSDTIYTYLTCNNVAWNYATLAPQYALIYRVSDGLLIACYDFGKIQTVSNGRFAINWNGDAVLTIRTDMYYQQPPVNEIADLSVEEFGTRPVQAGSGVHITVSLTDGSNRDFYIYDGENAPDGELDITSEDPISNRPVTQEFNRKINFFSINNELIDPISTEAPYGVGVLHNRINIDIAPIPRITIREIVFGETE